MNVFQAQVQYDDLTGSVAADRADAKSLVDYLKEIGTAVGKERIVGLRVAFNENSGAEITEPGVVVYLLDADEFVERPEKVRAVEINIPIAKLFSFFKRFDLVMTNSSVSLEDASVDGPHYE